ncbi:CU044_5270 family protein [Nonomuraea candida]|uniref:CU044_5270 family protein n=1 Tax=Nonomuraea candida TaxID=359159 RepID=UPI0005B7ECAB|nr:CU044_5270 family protein [Nonomuraea candida]
MNDLELIRRLRSEMAETGPDALTGARERLLAVMARQPAPRRSRRTLTMRVTGLAAAAAVAAAAVVIATGPAALPVKPPAAAGDVLPLTSARNVLLVAADSAERAPQGSGTYWHIKRESEDGRRFWGESWTTRDGQRWSRGEPGNGPGVVKEPSGTFWLGPADSGTEVTMDELEALPTDPEALRQKVTAMQQGGPVGEHDVALLPLASLIAELPAPADVRSAAFRALAGLPGVRRTGAVDGGEELLIQNGRHESRLVVDPETSRVIRTSWIPTATGGLMGTNRGLLIKLTTGWTDELPR